MYFLASKPEALASSGQQYWDHDLLKMKVNADTAAYVAFADEILAEHYIAARQASEVAYARPVATFDIELLDELDGGSIVFFGDQSILEESLRLGAEFDFSRLLRPFKTSD
ncbi:MAG: hypothetical protein AAFX93_02465 [Verrucomicrobiota bacterium]